MCKIYVSETFSLSWNGGWDYSKDSPLERRGWVMQETLLSTRILSFGSLAVVWHCQTVNTATPPVYGALERLKRHEHSGPRLPPVPFCASRVVVGLGLPQWMSQMPLGRPKQMEDTRGWMVGNFTSRQLTETNDRIAAMAGVVGELQRMWKDRYSFGLWERLGARGLCWAMPKEPSERLPIAPTWSWCSVWGFISYYPLLDCKVSIVKFPSASHPAAEKDPKQRVVLTVRGKLIPPHKVPQPPDETSPERFRHLRYFDANDAFKDITAYHLLYLGDGPLSRTLNRNREVKSNQPLFIILRQVEENTFERVGLFVHSSAETKFSSTWNSPFYRALETCSRRTIDLI